MSTLIRLLSVFALAFGLAAHLDAEAGTVTACAKKNGALRVVPGNACKRNESLLNLTRDVVTGPQGLKGDTGARGPQGDRGPPGESGLAGAGNPKVFDATGAELGFLADPTIITLYIPSLAMTARIDFESISPNYGNVALAKDNTTTQALPAYPQRADAKTCAGTPAIYYAVQYQLSQIVRGTNGKHYIARARTDIPPRTLYLQFAENGAAKECRELPNVRVGLNAADTYELEDIADRVPAGPPFSTPAAFPLSTSQ